MKREAEEAAGPVLIPGVVSLAGSARRTLKHGDTYALFDIYGDALEVERSPTGLFHHDTRHLSRLVLALEGHRPLMLSSNVQPDNVTLDVDLTNPDVFDDERHVLQKDTFHIARSKFLWEATCYELFSVASYAEQPTDLHFTLDFGADFADMFEIRGHPRARRGAVRVEPRGPAGIAFVYDALDGVPRATVLTFSVPPQRLSASRAEFDLRLPARERRSIALTVQCLHGDDAASSHRFFTAMRHARASRARMRASGAAIQTSSATFNSVLERAQSDLAMLTTDTNYGPYPYAGVPWFTTAFGRDGIITALEMLWLEPWVARGVLGFLAAHQAKTEDPAADREPGKILHEVRASELARLGEVPFRHYYGSIDSTPLFVALAGLYWTRTGERAMLETLWPSVLAGLEWIERYGDRDGDGFVEYERGRATGLRNQGWKDSVDSVMHADGRLAEGPIALCEVQAYVYLAQRLAARMASDMGDPSLSQVLTEKAERLKARFEAAFWCEDLGTYALALDGAKDPCRVRSSNAGHVLFAGLASPERAQRVALGLSGRDFFTGWGLRTLSSRERRFNPTSYHNGSIWPHDNALIGLGFSRYGHSAQALGLTTALFEAAARMPLRRIPELFCGFDRKRGRAPTLYPVACAPQAWSAASPVALLQACLGLRIDAAGRLLSLRRPRLPTFLDWLEIRRLQVGPDAQVDLLIRRDEESVAVSLLSRSGGAEVEVLL